MNKYSIYIEGIGKQDAESKYSKQERTDCIEENWDSISNYFNDTGKPLAIKYAELLDNETKTVVGTRTFPREIILNDGDTLHMDWNFKLEDYRGRFKITM